MTVAPVSADYTLTIVPDATTMGRLAADVVAATVRADPAAAISLPTGNSPLPLFAELIARVAAGTLDLSRVHLFCLDEYVGLTPEDPASLTGWLRQALIAPTGIDPSRVHALPATDDDPIAAAARYEADLAAHGGLALAVLGIGPNGHIGYNEPGSAADSRTRVLDLTQGSVDQAAAYWEGSVEVPRRAMTMGVATLLEARRLILIATGAGKAEIVRRALREPMSAEVPASWLRLAPERLEVILDEGAAGRLG